jgi:branched-chain amino acid transport system substrate-binding protein
VKILRALLLGLSVAAGACHTTRHTLTPEEPHNGDARARARFTDAKAKFLRDGTGSDDFKRIAEDFPSDPIVPWAQLYEGIADVQARRIPDAVKALEGVVAAQADPKLTKRAELFLGLARNYAGDAAGALALLGRSGDAVADDNEKTEYLAAVAYATAGSDKPLQALPVFDQLYPRVTPTERAAIVARVEAIVVAAPPDALARVADELPDRKGPSIAVAAGRLATLAEAAGNAELAKHLREVAAPARAAIGLPRTVETSGAAAGGAPGLVGAVVPLGGKQHRVAEQAVWGLGLAAGTADGKGVAAVEVRTANDADEAARAVDDLARANVIAIVGPVDTAAVEAASARAEALGVPLLSLAVQPEKLTTGGTYVFHIVQSPQQRARALARRALAKGVKSFAVLAGDGNYGKTVAAAFIDEVQKGGGTIVSSVTYKASTKSFAGIVGKLDGAWEALFVPEDAQTLGLVTPALDAAGLKPRPLGTKKAAGGRPILLLSTAENLTGAYLADAGRHSEGALFAPGYYPDDTDPANRAFLDRFIAAYGRAPGFVEAYAYDAAQLAAAAGAQGRAGLAGLLSSGELVGLTGTIRFGADHRRADPGVIYTVVRASDSFAIHVAR